MRTRRVLLLLTVWLSFDLATPFPGAFEFEVQDSEIEESVHVRRESHGRRTTGSARAISPDPVELARPGRPLAPPEPKGRPVNGDEWLPQLLLAQLPYSRP